MHWTTNAAVLLALPSFASFIGTVIDREPLETLALWRRSRCNSCEHTLSVRDLVPIASYLANYGRCRFCSAVIPRRYLIAELFAFVAGAMSLLAIGGANFIVSLPLALLLFALACFDFERGRLPNPLTLTLCVLGIVIAPHVAGSVWDHIVGVALGLTIGICIASLYKILSGKGGLGGGDIKLLAAVGAWLGWNSIFAVLLLSSLSALLFALATGRISRNAHLPFGPFIAAATWAVWCWGFAARAGQI